MRTHAGVGGDVVEGEVFGGVVLHPAQHGFEDGMFAAGGAVTFDWYEYAPDAV